MGGIEPTSWGYRDTTDPVVPQWELQNLKILINSDLSADHALNAGLGCSANMPHLSQQLQLEPPLVEFAVKSTVTFQDPSGFCRGCSGEGGCYENHSSILQVFKAARISALAPRLQG